MCIFLKNIKYLMASLLILQRQEKHRHTWFKSNPVNVDIQGSGSFRSMNSCFCLFVCNFYYIHLINELIKGEHMAQCICGGTLCPPCETQRSSSGHQAGCRCLYRLSHLTRSCFALFWVILFGFGLDFVWFCFL